MIYVQAAWCGPCRKLERETLSDPDVLRMLRGWSLVKLTFDDHDRIHRVGPYRLSEAAWASRFGADSTPALVFVAPDGGILARRIGFVPPEGLMQLLAAGQAALEGNDSEPR